MILSSASSSTIQKKPPSDRDVHRSKSAVIEFMVDLYHRTAGTKARRACIPTDRALKKTKRERERVFNRLKSRIYLLEFGSPFEFSFSMPYFLGERKENSDIAGDLHVRLPPGKHHVQAHSSVRDCNLHVKQGQHKNAKQPKQRSLVDRWTTRFVTYTFQLHRNIRKGPYSIHSQSSRHYSSVAPEL